MQLSTLVYALSLVLVATPAVAGLGVRTRIQCPDSAQPGTTASIDVELTNPVCTALGVRLISTYSGNDDETVSDAAVFGPVVTVPSSVVVPAATENSPGGCSFGNVTPGILNVNVAAPPQIPNSLAETVAAYSIIAEWNAGATTQVDTCLIPLPEPSRFVQLVSGLAGLLALSHLRRERLRHPTDR
jgi:hypothetical protein